MSEVKHTGITFMCSYYVVAIVLQVIISETKLEGTVFAQWKWFCNTKEMHKLQSNAIAILEIIQCKRKKLLFWLAIGYESWMSEHTGITFMCSYYKIQKPITATISLDIYLLVCIKTATV